MQIKKGNTVDLEFTIKDSDGTLVINLSTVVDVKFMAKNEPTDADVDAVISKSLGDGITVDDPSTGIVKVALTSTDTSVTAKRYSFALQLEYSDSIQEVTIRENRSETNVLDIVQDIIR